MLNVWTVLWQSPDGKPFAYSTRPADKPVREKPETRFYCPEDVVKFKRMAKRHLPNSQFRCLSNVDVPGVQCVPLLHPGVLIAWWAKMELFRPGMPEGRNIYFDLDTIMLREIDKLPVFDAPFAAIEPGLMVGSDQPNPWLDQEGKWRVPRYQTSCIVWDTPYVAKFWDDFRADQQRHLDYLASDQDFLGERHPDEARMPTEWFSKLRKKTASVPDSVKLLLTIGMRNDEAAQRHPWVREIWSS